MKLATLLDKVLPSSNINKLYQKIVRRGRERYCQKDEKNGKFEQMLIT
jgi:hypothetical protein